MRDLYSNLSSYGGAMREVNQRAMTADFAQHSLNWLITARFYIEAERAHLESVYGSDSDEFARFHQARHRAYDTHPGYRFTYKLRVTSRSTAVYRSRG